MNDPALRRWAVAGTIALVVVLVAVPLSRLRERPLPAQEPGSATFVGTAACVDCHQTAADAWRGSDHDLAMDLADDDTVLGDFDDVEFTAHGITSRFFRKDGRFFVRTQGPAGEMGDFEITHVFGHDPLQQYLVPFPGGRMQCLNIAWDRVREEWFHLSPEIDVPPDDWLHWTRNGQNWNGMCAECHSTHLQKNYDPATDSYNTTWTDIDVGCEACHGPGSAHVAWAEQPAMARDNSGGLGLVQQSSGLTSTELVELCAPCHSRRAEVGDYDHVSGDFLDVALPALLRDGLYHPDGQILDEVYVYGSFVQSKMYANDVRCSDCHDSHSLQLVREGNELCGQCHELAVYDTTAHHFHKLEVDGQPSDGAKCVKCHMVEQPYMVIDWRADHSFRLPRPDLSASLGVPNACTQSGCHDDRPLQWSIDAWNRWYGEARRPHFGTAFAAARGGDPSGLVEIVQSPLQPALVRATALELLAVEGAESLYELCAALLLAPESILRHAAVTHLPLLDPAEFAQQVAPLLADPAKAVRMAASSRLAAVDPTLLADYQLADLDRGFAEYRASMAANLDFAHAAMNLGTLSARLGDQTEAERYLRQALVVDDRFVPARANLAVLLAGGGRDAEATALLEEGVRLTPEEPELWRMLGLMYAGPPDPSRGLEPLRRAVELNPRDARAHYNLGLLMDQLGDLDGAERHLGAALEIVPRSPDFLYALAEHYLRRKMFDEVIPLADRLTELLPDQPIGAQMRQAAEAGN
jgi:tetratricopeptide (TPR) repeat protein